MTWGDEQIALYRERHANGTMARLALELMLNIAARRHDAHLIGRQHLRDAKLSWRPNKTSRTTGKLLTIRVLPELQAALDAMPPSNALTFLLTGPTVRIGCGVRKQIRRLGQGGGLEAGAVRRRQGAKLSCARAASGGGEAHCTRGW